MPSWISAADSSVTPGGMRNTASAAASASEACAAPVTATRSPAAMPATAEPARRTVPALEWPGRPRMPTAAFGRWRYCARSVPGLTALTVDRIVTEPFPGRGTSTGTSSA